MVAETKQYFTDSEFHPGDLAEANWDGSNNICSIVADNDVTLRIYVVSDHIFRFRYSTDGYFPSASNMAGSFMSFQTPAIPISPISSLYSPAHQVRTSGLVKSGK